MYENIIHQEVTKRLETDIKAQRFPNSVLFSGPVSSGKLTTALETARVLSCQDCQAGGRRMSPPAHLPQARWQCTCPSCVRIKALTSPYVMLLGSRNSSLEIAAAKDALLKAVLNEATYIDGARHFFLRAVRKLTIRFSTILWDGDALLNKASALTAEIDEMMAEIDFPAALPDETSLSKTLNKIEELCQKLETSFLYDTIPIRHIRNVSAWSRLKVSGSKRVVIIEDADKMMEGVRNSLLKILEEPPDDTFFILTTARRAAVMSTILSRVRAYTLRERTKDEQKEVISRIFHAAPSDEASTINGYLEKYLPVSPLAVREAARNYISSVASGLLPDTNAAAKSCASFKPRALLAIFMDEAAHCLMKEANIAAGNAAAEGLDALRDASSAIGTYNINAAACLENLFVTLSRINRKFSG